jgi:DNA-binding XRE family transcriptional regulator
MKATQERDCATPPEDALGHGRHLNRTFVTSLAEARGWRNATEIAAGLGINRATYFRMLNGTYQPLLATARKMAHAADVTVDELFPAGPAAA